MQATTLKNNQVMVTTEDGRHFYSYDTFIGFRDNNGNIYLTSSWDYSNTTLKYLREAFPTLSGYSKKEIAKMLENREGIFPYSEYNQNL